MALGGRQLTPDVDLMALSVARLASDLRLETNAKLNARDQAYLSLVRVSRLKLRLELTRQEFQLTKNLVEDFCSTTITITNNNDNNNLTSLEFQSGNVASIAGFESILLAC